MTDTDKTPVAGVVVTRCTKCRLDLGHVVISHNKKGTIAMVKCNSCGREHKYYSETQRLQRKKKSEEAAKVAEKNAQAEEYDRLLKQNPNKRSKIYCMSNNYRENDFIDHKTFGKGVITKINHQKMDVLFETGARLLACDKYSPN